MSKWPKSSVSIVTNGESEREGERRYVWESGMSDGEVEVRWEEEKKGKKEEVIGVRRR